MNNINNGIYGEKGPMDNRPRVIYTVVSLVGNEQETKYFIDWNKATEYCKAIHKDKDKIELNGYTLNSTSQVK